jgi:hypothetical protein
LGNRQPVPDTEVDEAHVCTRKTGRKSIPAAGMTPAGRKATSKGEGEIPSGLPNGRAIAATENKGREIGTVVSVERPGFS